MLFDMTELQLKQVREVFCKARASSVPRPSSTAARVYKNCPKLVLQLWMILHVSGEGEISQKSGEWVTDYHCAQCPETTFAQHQPPIRAFSDDLKVSTESVPGCRWILQGLKKIVKWAQMCFKPAKSRSLVLRKGKVEDNFRFNIEGTAITIHHRETNQEPKQGLWQLAVGRST